MLWFWFNLPLSSKGQFFTIFFSFSMYCYYFLKTIQSFLIKFGTDALFILWKTEKKNMRLFHLRYLCQCFLYCVNYLRKSFHSVRLFLEPGRCYLGHFFGNVFLFLEIFNVFSWNFHANILVLLWQLQNEKKYGILSTPWGLFCFTKVLFWCFSMLPVTLYFIMIFCIELCDISLMWSEPKNIVHFPLCRTFLNIFGPFWNMFCNY